MSSASRPLYFRMLRLRHLHPRPATTFLLFEGSVGLGLLLALAEVVNGWGAIAIPICVALTVKLNDVVATALVRPFALAQLATPRPAEAKAVGRSAIPRPNVLRSEPAGRVTGRPGQIRARSAARGVAPVRPESSDRVGSQGTALEDAKPGDISPADPQPNDAQPNRGNQGRFGPN